MKDYLLQQFRESSTWRGAVVLLTGLAVLYILWHVPLPQVDATHAEDQVAQIRTIILAIRAIAFGMCLKGLMALGMPDATKAGTAVKNAQAQAAVDAGTVVVPPPPP